MAIKTIVIFYTFIGLSVYWSCADELEKPKVVRGELHMSPKDLEGIFAFDTLVGDALKYINTPNEEAKKYLESYGWVTVDARLYGGDTSHPSIVGHPLHVYTLIKRLVIFFPKFMNVFEYHANASANRNISCRDNHSDCDLWKYHGRCFKEEKLMRKLCPESCGICITAEKSIEIVEAEKEILLPSSQDLLGAALAVGYLQKVYNLRLGDLMKGQIYNVYSSVELDDWDCVRIAEALSYNNRLSSAYLWYSYIRKSTTDPKVAAYCTDLQNSVAEEHDENWDDTDDYFPELLRTHPNQKSRPSNFYQLCRGRKLPTDGDLRCELSTRDHPYFVLQPVKQETVLKDPEMYIFHDIITETEIETLKFLSVDNLFKDWMPARISQMAYLNHTKNLVIDAINKRTNMLTGLLSHEGTTESIAAEPIKIRRYGTGGFLVPHVDVLYKQLEVEKWDNRTFGDRMATVIYYFNNVDAGGRTAFFRSNISLAPEKGSAVFWYNLKKNGDYDERLDHGGCPVVLGNKWIALKWTREDWNMMLRPCSLDADE